MAEGGSGLGMQGQDEKSLLKPDMVPTDGPSMRKGSLLLPSGRIGTPLSSVAFKQTERGGLHISS